MTTLELLIMILMIIGILVYCGGLILIKNESNLKFWWIEIGTCIFVLYIVVCMTIWLAVAPDNTHINYRIKNDPIYVTPVYPY